MDRDYFSIYISAQKSILLLKIKITRKNTLFGIQTKKKIRDLIFISHKIFFYITIRVIHYLIVFLSKFYYFFKNFLAVELYYSSLTLIIIFG